MKILSFAFNGEEDNAYLPERIEKNSVCYTGTHDNDTLVGLIESFDAWDRNNMIRGVSNSLSKFGIKRSLGSAKALARAVIELGYASQAETFIIPLADAAYLGGEYRMNTPGHEGGNWTCKMPTKAFSSQVRDRLRKLTEKYDRA
jgi:4-alpha-glucanotransferase